MNTTASPGLHGDDRCPFISVVIETVTAREERGSGSLADRLAPTLSAVAAQTYPRDRVETIVVLDAAVSESAGAEIRSRYPTVIIGRAALSNYFAAKNRGADMARAPIVALLDGDCVPAPDWLACLVSACGPGRAVVAGRTRYSGNSWFARTFSVSDFGNVVAAPTGEASGFNLNNVLFRRDVLTSHPLEARVRRNGGCFLLYHELRALGLGIVYEPRAVVTHGLDIAGLGFVRKHFDRGFDGVGVYRLDEHGVLRGTRLFRRFGALALVPLFARRAMLDWVRLARDRRQMGIAAVAVPYFACVMFGTRFIELVGGLVAVVDRDRYARAGLAQPPGRSE